MKYALRYEIAMQSEHAWLVYVDIVALWWIKFDTNTATAS